MADNLFSPNQITGIEGGFGAFGLAGSIYGSLEQSQGAKAKYAAEKQIAGLEMQADEQRRQAMELSARRQQLQTVRTAQQARAMALSSAVGQGAQFSSSAAAGQAQTSSQAAYANLGVSQNLQFGEQMFNINEQIDAQKIAESEAESKMASGAGLSSMFGAFGKSAQGLSSLFSLIPAL